ncbi:hypothetical protein Gohar_027425 [Gossypium harknessii]|uniref:Uncharacterized protein n=1 Tax=Gossypium harknessii TaxID=34285 RepID=A0A7J9HUP6_9ROSI|nr:hypothetical protein [Gossypium harknessii]
MATPVCPFVKAARPDDTGSEKKLPPVVAKPQGQTPAKLPPNVFSLIGPPFNDTFILFTVCISRFKDCLLCGADIEKLEADTNLQSMVDRFIEGHARMKRPHVDANGGGGEQVVNDDKKVIYEDISLDRGAFLVQQAMRAFRAQNIKSAQSRLIMCTQDIRVQLEKTGNTSEFCSQLGAVLGMLGDCWILHSSLKDDNAMDKLVDMSELSSRNMNIRVYCSRAMGDSAAAINYFEESVEFLTKLPTDDLETTHALSVSLNKIGDLKYYDGDLQAARSYYLRSLGVRRDVIKNNSGVASQVIDVAVSLAKVADVDRILGKDDEAIDGFQEAIKLLESLSLKSNEASLEPQIRSH